MDILFWVGVAIIVVGILMAVVLVRDAVTAELKIPKNWREIIEEYDKSE